MLRANKTIRDNEVVNIYEMTVEDFNRVKATVEKLALVLILPPYEELMNNLVNYFHLQGDMKEV